MVMPPQISIIKTLSIFPGTPPRKEQGTTPRQFKSGGGGEDGLSIIAAFTL